MLAPPPSISVGGDEERQIQAIAMPPAPKRRRANDGRASRLAGFAAAAQLPKKTKAVERIQAAFRGHRVRERWGPLVRPSTSSSVGDELLDEEEVPEEIADNEVDDGSSLSKGLTSLSLMTAAVAAAAASGPIDSALEASGEFLESSNDSLAGDLSAALQQPAERTCAICLAPMQRKPSSRQRGLVAAGIALAEGSGAAPSSPATPARLKVATLECGHRFHARCLYGWCRQKPPGQCPLCREEVRVRRRDAGAAASSSGGATVAPFGPE